MKYLLFFSSFLFLVSCKESAKTEANTSDTARANQPIAKADSAVWPNTIMSVKGMDVIEYPLSINPALPPATFYVMITDNIIGLAFEKYNVIQKFPVGDEVNFENTHFLDPATFISVQDFNFDGYKDLMLLSSSGSGGTWYNIYLFNKNTKLFIPHEGLTKLTSPSVDSINKTISMYDVGGMAGAWYNAATYKWEDTTLVAIREESQSSETQDSEVYIRTISVRGEDGKMKVVSSVRIEMTPEEKERLTLLEGTWKEFDKSYRSPFGSTDDEIIRVDSTDRN